MNIITIWENEWNDIIRNKIFKNEKIKSLMLLPNNISIIDFIDNYFIRSGYATKTLTDEKVRILYSDMASSIVGSENVVYNKIIFDIFVKLDCIHNISNDRLLLRTTAIANELNNILCSEKNINGYNFWVDSMYDPGTRTIGYGRKIISFNYTRVV